MSPSREHSALPDVISDYPTNQAMAFPMKSVQIAELFLLRL